MAARKSQRVRAEEPDAPPPLWRSLRGAVITVAILLCIAYVALQVLCRTAGFREVLSQRIAARFDLPVGIARSAVNWRFDITLDDVASKGADAGSGPSLSAKRIRIGWAPLQRLRGGMGIRSIEADGLAVVFAPAPGGEWTPRPLAPLSAFLSRWAEMPVSAGSASPAAVETAPDPGGSDASPSVSLAAVPKRMRDEGIRVAVRGADVTWRAAAADAGPLAVIEGASLDVVPMKGAGRSFLSVALAVDRAASAGGDGIRNLRLELLDAGDQQIVLGFTAERTSVER